MAKKTFKKNVTSDFFNVAEKQQESLDDKMKSSIKILPELEKLILPLTNEEFFQLEENILAEGCHDALVLWKKGNEHVLIDGHNRYAICTRYKRDFKVEIKDFKNISEVKDWMISNQLGKRNITEETKSYLRGMRYNQEKGKRGGDKKSKGQSDTLINKADSLAEAYKVSERIIKRDSQYTDAIDKLTGKDNELKWKILNKDIHIPKGKVIDIASKGTEEIKKARVQLKKAGSLKAASKSILNKNISESENWFKRFIKNLRRYLNLKKI